MRKLLAELERECFESLNNLLDLTSIPSEIKDEKHAVNVCLAIMCLKAKAHERKYSKMKRQINDILFIIKG